MWVSVAVVDLHVDRSGVPARSEDVADLVALAARLAEFLVALYAIDPSDGPAAGLHSFFRGGRVSTYDEETRMAINALAGVVDAAAASRVWEEALAASWSGPPAYLHVEIAASNLVVVNGELVAVHRLRCAAWWATRRVIW